MSLLSFSSPFSSFTSSRVREHPQTASRGSVFRFLCEPGFCSHSFPEVHKQQKLGGRSGNDQTVTQVHKSDRVLLLFSSPCLILFRTSVSSFILLWPVVCLPGHVYRIKRRMSGVIFQCGQNVPSNRPLAERSALLQEGPELPHPRLRQSGSKGKNRNTQPSAGS